jgi:phosphoribosylanthranilate isomerase
MLRVKVCGIRRVEDAVLAADLGAWGVGFIFWPGSPRFIDPYRAKTICRALPPWVVPVGVFVDQPSDYVSAVATLVQLGAVQLHGNETVETIERLPHRVIKSVPVTENFDEAIMDRLPNRVGVLLDTHDPRLHGGTGRTVDWTRGEGGALPPPAQGVAGRGPLSGQRARRRRRGAAVCYRRVVWCRSLAGRERSRPDAGTVCRGG